MRESYAEAVYEIVCYKAVNLADEERAEMRIIRWASDVK